MGLLPPLIKSLEQQNNEIIVKTACYALTNLIKNLAPNYAPFLKFNIFEVLIPHLNSSDPEVVSEAFWVISYFTTHDDLILTLAQSPIIPILLAQLDQLANRGPLALSLIRTLGNIFCLSDHVTSILLEHQQLLPTINKCLYSESRSVVKETVWILENLTTCQPPLLDEVIEHELFPQRVVILFGEGSTELKKEIALCLLNIAFHMGKYLQKVLLWNTMPEFIGFLQNKDYDIVILGIQFLEIAFSQNPHQTMGMLGKGVSHLEALQYRGERDLTSRSGYLLQKYVDPLKKQLSVQNFALNPLYDIH